MDNNDILLRLDSKVDKIQDSVHSIDKTLVLQHEQLVQHIKRTKIAEDRLDKFEEIIQPSLESYRFVSFIFKIIICAATLLGAYYKYRH